MCACMELAEVFSVEGQDGRSAEQGHGDASTIITTTRVPGSPRATTGAIPVIDLSPKHNMHEADDGVWDEGGKDRHKDFGISSLIGLLLVLSPESATWCASYPQSYTREADTIVDHLMYGEISANGWHAYAICLMERRGWFRVFGYSISVVTCIALVGFLTWTVYFISDFLQGLYSFL